MLRPLNRHSLSEQATTYLRQGIREVRWRGELPSEVQLCREMQVSRVTLRAALTQLAEEKLIVPGGRGRHHRIRARKKASPRKEGHIVRFLSPYRWSQAGVSLMSLCEGIASRLGRQDYRLEIEIHPAIYTRDPARELKRLCELPDTAGWIISFGTEVIQRWVAQHDYPCVIVGYAYPEARISHVYPDTRAIARHAAGAFVRRGYRDLAYFIAELTSLGDRLASQAFVEEAARLGARAQIIQHSGEPSGLRSVLKQQLHAGPRGTAYFSTSPEHCVTILTTLLRAGLSIPKDAAVLCGQADPMLFYTAPTIAHYETEPAKLGRKAGSLFLSVLQEGKSRLRSTGMQAKFVSAESLG